MKKFILIALIAFGINAKAQIALENTYPNGSINAENIRFINLTTGAKYALVNSTTFQLDIFNLNHSLYKSVPIPSQVGFDGWYVNYISDKLFDNDSTDIEYLIFRYKASPIFYSVIIYDESGNTTFSLDSATVGGFNPNYSTITIFNTDSGTKMILSGSPSPQVPWAKVYSLPGYLISGPYGSTYQQQLINGESSLYISSITNPYPNPTNSSTRIDYTFPNGVNQGEIVFYDLQGKELKRFKVDKTFDHLLISTTDIPAGTYFFQLQTSNQASEGKKMVVIK